MARLQPHASTSWGSSIPSQPLRTLFSLRTHTAPRSTVDTFVETQIRDLDFEEWRVQENLPRNLDIPDELFFEPEEEDSKGVSSVVNSAVNSPQSANSSAPSLIRDGVSTRSSSFSQSPYWPSSQSLAKEETEMDQNPRLDIHIQLPSLREVFPEMYPSIAVSWQPPSSQVKHPWSGSEYMYSQEPYAISYNQPYSRQHSQYSVSPIFQPFRPQARDTYRRRQHWDSSSGRTCISRPGPSSRTPKDKRISPKKKPHRPRNSNKAYTREQVHWYVILFQLLPSQC